MIRPVILVLAVVLSLFLAVFGCAGEQPSQQTPPLQSQPNQTEQQQASEAQNSSVRAAAGGAGAGEEAGLAFGEWKAPDGSITLQVPEGWTANEKQADKCSVNWAVRDPAGTSSAFMNNQIMMFKSEGARAMYKSYGMTGIDNAPVSGYLGAEQAMQQIIAPLSGSSKVKVLSRDATLSLQFSQAACIAGLAACDAQVFEAAFDHDGMAMRGYYLVQTYDFGEGTTWWINLWGYEAPAAEWEKSVGTVEKIFTSAAYTEAWAAKCGKSPSEAETVIGEVVKSRQAASEKSAEEWDRYIRGE